MIGDMVLICMHYGSDAYFEQGLRIAKHKPYTLSTGVVLSSNLSTLGWFVDTCLWIGLVAASMYLLGGVASLFTRMKQRAATR